MNKLHPELKKVLEQKIRASEAETLSPDLLEAVNEAYQSWDKERADFDRAIKMSSMELIAATTEMQVQNVELQAIYKVALELQEAGFRPSAYSQIASQIAEVTGFPVVCILRTMDVEHGYRILALIGAEDLGKTLRQELIPRETLPQFESDEIFSTGDLRPNLERCGFFKSLPLQSMIAVPLRMSGTNLGHLIVAHPLPEQNLPRWQTWLVSVASQLSSELERQNLSQLSELNKALVISASKMSELGKMAGGVAHEINTPLNTILLLAESLRGELDERSLPNLAKLAATIESTVKRIAAIVKGLRTFSRDGSGDDFASANLAQVVRDTLALCGERFRSNQVQLRMHLREDVVLNCRETQISQLLLNLLNNAYDAVLGRAERWIEIRLEDLGEMVQLSVVDSGAGVPAELQYKLGMPFFTTKPIGAGTGLGLSISMGIARDHGGQLELDPGSSHTRFVLRLPKNPRNS